MFVALRLEVLDPLPDAEPVPDPSWTLRSEGQGEALGVGWITWMSG